MATRKDSQSFEQFVARIDDEFGEPAVDVIRGMREQGQSWATIAGALDVHETTLRKWVERAGWRDGLRAHRNHWVDGGTINHRAQALGYDDLRQMLTDYYMRGLTQADAARALACNRRSFSHAISGGLDLPPRPGTPAQLAAWRANAQRINDARRRSRTASSPATMSQ